MDSKRSEFEEIENLVTAESETPITVDPESETPAADVVTTAEAVPAAKKRGRPPKKVTPPPKNDSKIEPPPKTDSKIEPPPKTDAPPDDQQALLNSLAELIKRNDAIAYNAKMQLY